MAIIMDHYTDHRENQNNPKLGPENNLMNQTASIKVF